MATVDGLALVVRISTCVILLVAVTTLELVVWAVFVVGVVGIAIVVSKFNNFIWLTITVIITSPNKITNLFYLVYKYHFDWKIHPRNHTVHFY